MFQQVIEDAHSKYHISYEDIKEMCKDAVNRAADFLDTTGFSPKAINGELDMCHAIFQDLIS